MSFNFSRKFDFLPKLSIGNEQLEVVYSTKLLGVIISSDLKWNLHTEYAIKKAKKKLWCLRRLRKLGASITTLLDQYIMIVRNTLEQATPIFSGALSKSNSDDFEDVQKTAFKIILKGNYKSYENALTLLDQETLENRRKQLATNFAKKNVRHPKMKHLFPVKKNLPTRSGVIYEETQYKTKRAQNGPVNHLIRLLNNSS